MPKSDKRQNNRNNKDENSTLKRVIMIVIVIIIILLLITSCSSVFFGKVGNFFDGTSDYEIDEDNKTLEKIYNKELKFISTDGEALLDDVYKIEFDTSKLATDKYTCSTSDASIATCVVKDNYIVVYPKKVGKVTINVSAKLNGKEYIGTHRLTVKAPNRSISLDSDNGSINLAEYSTLEISYHLNNLSGNVKIKSSNDKVATAIAKNGILTITGHKTGKAVITLIVEYRGHQYETTYDITVNNNKSIRPNGTNNKYNGTTGGKRPSGNNGGGTGSSSGNSGSSTTPSTPKSNVKTIERVRTSVGKLSPSFDKNTTSYTLKNVPSGTKTISLDLDLTSTKSRAYYYVNGKSVSSLSNITLNTDSDTPIKIVVVAEDGSTKVYNIVVEHESTGESSIKTLEKIELFDGDKKVGINPKFNKDETDYVAEVSYDVDKITMKVETTDDKSKVYIDGSKENKKSATIKLEEGSNKVKIKVVAENGTTKTYEVDIIRKKKGASEESSIKTLSSLILKNGNEIIGYTPTFDKDHNKYSAEVSHNVDKITINTETTDSKAKVYINNSKVSSKTATVELTEGINTITIKVEAENGTTKTYTVKVDRLKEGEVPKSSDNTLGSVSLNPGVMTGVNNKTYTAEVENNISETTITAVPNDSKAKVYINGSKVDGKTTKVKLTGKVTSVNVVVEAENGAKETYTVEITKKDKTPTDPISKIATLDKLYPSVGNFNEGFSKDNLKYTMTVPKDTDSVTINAVPTDKNAKIYIGDSKTPSTSGSIALVGKDTEIKVRVVAEDNKTEKTYTVKVTKSDGSKSDVNTLEKIKINDKTSTLLEINKPSPNSNYSTKVKYNTDSIELAVDKTHSGSVLEVKYKNGNGDWIAVDKDKLNSIPVASGENKLQIVVISESNVRSKPYEITINRPTRTINLDNKDTDVLIAINSEKTRDITYSIFEDTDKLLDDGKYYSADDITYSIDNGFNGTIDIKLGKISITPDVSDVNKTFTLTVNYAGTTSSRKIVVKDKMEYYMWPSSSDTYYFNRTSGIDNNNFIIHTNIFNNSSMSDITITDIVGGKRITNNKNGGYIDIKSNDTSVIEINGVKEMDQSSITISINPRSIGLTNIVVSGYASLDMEPFTMKTEVTDKYIVKIDANGGFFNAFADKYVYLKDSTEEVVLSDYQAYKVEGKNATKSAKKARIVEDNCNYYKATMYTTYPGEYDASTLVSDHNTVYTLEEVVEMSKYTDKNITLYAQYEKITSEEDKPKMEGRLYLTDVDLFKNEEYYKKHPNLNNGKVIYPGASGSHTAYITNNTGYKVKIKNIFLEEDTNCVKIDGNDGCINMGYIVKYTRRQDNTWKYFYGGKDNQFTILNQNKDSDSTTPVISTEGTIVSNKVTLPRGSSETIELEPKEDVAISILWKWVEANDILDSKIGNIAKSIGKENYPNDAMYALTVSFEYETDKSYCSN